MSDRGKIYPLPLPFLLALVCLALMFAGLASSHFFPDLTCPVKDTWGIDCPGCGGTRAVRSIITGNLHNAFIYNPLISFCILAVSAYFLLFLISKIVRKNLPQPTISIHKGICFMVITIVFVIIRNL